MKQEFPKYASVILELSLDRPLDYGITEDQLKNIQRGSRVAVPVRGTLRYGYVFDIKESSEFSRVFPIANIESDSPLITEEVFKLALWISKYYCAPLSAVFKTILPASVRKNVSHKQQLYVMRAKTREQLIEHCIAIRNKHPAQAAVIDEMLKVTKGILLTELLELTNGSRSPVDTLVKNGWLLIDIVRINRSPLVNEEYIQTKNKKLNNDQAAALSKINKTLEEKKFEAHLLYGITGSGKTEIYLQAIEQALKMGKGTIMLVPEISLTAQTIERFRSRFNDHIAVLHHRLSQGERYDEWHKIYRGEAKIVIGARSAIFSPVQDLGLIIVDEEHEQSYKQSEEAPCYHARDVAVVRGKMSNCAVILGSATPSLESYYNCQTGKYRLSHLHARADSATIADVKVVDMKREYEKAKGYTNFSEELLDGIKKRQERGEQTILFLNRRGYHTSLSCEACGETIKCKHCDVSLTYHKNRHELTCHLCGYRIPKPPTQCPSCRQQDAMKFRGVGTEQIERSLHAIFPDIRTIRVDADTTRHQGSHQKLLKDFGTGKAEVLIGTQMIAKGLHFPNVTLVGVLNSDTALNIPDFRASETAFQLITQVAGRSGRGATKGEVIIQTQLPDNPTIQHAIRQDYDSFYQEEIAVRELFHYPPFSSIAKISFSGTDQGRTLHVANEVQRSIGNLLTPDYTIQPVCPCGHLKVKDKFRYQFLLRGPAIYPINQAIDQTLKKLAPSKTVKIHVDINPTSTFF